MASGWEMGCLQDLDATCLVTSAAAGFTSIGVGVETCEFVRCLFGCIAKLPLILLCLVDLLFCHHMVNNNTLRYR